MITGSIVTYNTCLEDIKKLMSSFNYFKQNYKIFIVDNSPTNELSIVTSLYMNTTYIHNPSNPGFGTSHNIALDKAMALGSKYHFIINPDVYFIGDIISPMINYMIENLDVGMMMPRILNLDGSIQNLPKLLPSPFSVLMRKLKRPKFIYKNFINKYELRNVKQDLIYDAPILSGCFTLFNMMALKEISNYDDRFFMYFEDWDISRRMHLKYKTIYFPVVSVYHGYESGANNNTRLFKIFIQSAVHYFNKWGWFFDKERIKINKKTLNQFK